MNRSFSENLQKIKILKFWYPITWAWVPNMDAFMFLGDPLGNFSPHAPSRWPVMGCFIVVCPPWVSLGAWSAPCSCQSTNWYFFDQASVFLIHNTHKIPRLRCSRSNQPTTNNLRFVAGDPTYHLFIHFHVDGVRLGCGPQRKRGRYYGVCMCPFMILKDFPCWNWIKTTSIGSSNTVSQALGNAWKGDMWGHPQQIANYSW